MKNLLILFIVCFLFLQGSFAFAQTNKFQVKNDLMERELKGKVKTFREGIYYFEKNSGRKTYRGDTTFIQFDTMGYMIQYLVGYLGNDCFEYWKSVIKYDSNHNRIQQTDSSLTKSVCIYKFGVNGTEIEKTCYDSVGKYYKGVKTVYDSMGNQSEWTIRAVRGRNDTLYRKYDYQCIIIENHNRNGFSYIVRKDKYGNPVYFYDSSMDRKKLTEIWFINKYDSFGNLLEIKAYDLKTPVLFRCIYKYNRSRKHVKISRCDSLGKLESKVFLNYDRHKNQIKYSDYDSLGNLDYQEIRKYDRHGNKIKIKTTKLSYFNTKSKTEQKIINKFDKTDNLIRSSEYKNGKPKKIIVRKIEFY